MNPGALDSWQLEAVGGRCQELEGEAAQLRKGRVELTAAQGAAQREHAATADLLEQQVDDKQARLQQLHALHQAGLEEIEDEHAVQQWQLEEITAQLAEATAAIGAEKARAQQAELQVTAR